MSKKAILATIIAQWLFCFIAFLTLCLIAEYNGFAEWIIWLLIIIFLVSTSVFVWGIWFSVSYICSECGTAFRPKFWSWFFALHFFNKRKLKCPNCKKKLWCEYTIKNSNTTKTDTKNKLN